MEEKITTLVAIVGIAVAISKEAREWYKATKKKNDKTQPAKEGYDVFQEGKDNFPPLNYILIRKRKSR